jgi:hypothetical protein
LQFHGILGFFCVGAGVAVIQNDKSFNQCTATDLLSPLQPGVTCNFGAMTYNHDAWTSPPIIAMFRLCSGSKKMTPPKTINGLPGACKWGSSWNINKPKIKSSCEIARCACAIALNQLKVQYPAVSFNEDKPPDSGIQIFEDLCDKYPSPVK